jgi:uncharacterized protein
MDNEVIAFHSKNLEVAEISDELWQEMPKAQFSTADQNENVFYSDNFKYLQMWSAETNPDVLTKQVAFKVNSLTLNVTQICNLQCTYCAAGGDGTFGNPQSKISIEKTLPQLDYFLKKINSQESFIAKKVFILHFWVENHYFIKKVSSLLPTMFIVF